jgi:lipopolysaccharide export system protein LptA
MGTTRLAIAVLKLPPVSLWSRFPLLALAAALALAAPSSHAQDRAAPAVTATQKPAATAPANPVATDGKATNSGSMISGGQGPVEITAEDSLEYHQSEKVYIAHRNAVAKRGDRSIYADTLMVYYRDIPNSSQTEPWRYVADGHVKVVTPTQTVVGDHGIYDLDTKTVVMTGQGLKLTTLKDVITARDSLEWYDDKQLAVGRGDALAIRTTEHGERRIRGDILAAQVAQAPGEAQRITRVDGTGHVLVSGPDQIGTGDKGVYNVDTGIATLSEHVTLARGDNTLVGQYGVVDLEKGVSRLLPRPPTANDEKRGRVQGYIIPRKKNPEQPNGKPAPTATPASTEKGQPEGDKTR